MNDDQLMAEWQATQREIASKVCILEDNDDADDDNGDYCAMSSCGSNSSRFYALRLNQLGEENKLYGGVDVSFAPIDPADRGQSSKKGGDMAVAVYVVIRRKNVTGSNNSISTTSNTSANAPAVSSVDKTSTSSNDDQQMKKKKKQIQQHGDILSCNYELVYSDYVRYKVTVPYISTYLAFREIDPLQRLVSRQLEQYPQYTPRAILVDGNGILHPRRAGMACFLGVRTGIPTIGVGKKLCCVEEDWSSEKAEHGTCLGLNEAVESIVSAYPGGTDAGAEALQAGVGKESEQSDILVMDTKAIRFGCLESTYFDVPSARESVQKLVPYSRGYTVNLQSSSDIILGAVLVGHGGKSHRPRSKATAKSIYISVGHNISLRKAVQFCAELSDVRIPEPVRVADLIGRKLIRKDSSDK